MVIKERTVRAPSASDLAVKDLVEDWIAIRAILLHQLKSLESAEIATAVADSTTRHTVQRLKTWVEELNALLKDYASVDRR